MRRRDFITLLGGGAAAALPLAARAQQSGMPVIGFLGLGLGSSTSNGGAPPDFLRGLDEAGYVLGRNLAIEFRWANFYESLLPRQAVDLLRRQVAVIVTTGSPYAARAAKDTTSTIPIVFVIAEDPVKYGLVASFNRPGGNVTGVTMLTTELTGKRLNLLLELVPGATKIGYLSVPGPIFEEQRDNALAAGRALGREIIVSEVRNLRFEAAFGFLAEQQASGLLVGNYTLFSQERYRNKILELAARHKIPAIYPSQDYAANEGLMSYAARSRAVWGQVANYTTRLLKGERAGNLPVTQPTTFDFVINLKAAREQSLTVPPSLLTIADEVIE
jgi:putative tryptophan/tyrosine transport system substrate-binding protein